MKKALLTITSISFLFLSILILASCSLFKDYEKECMKNIETFVEYLNVGNANGIKSFFAKSKVDEIGDFDASVNNLLSYYDTTEGKLEFSEIPGEEGDQNGNYKAKWYLAPYKIDIDDKVKYRVAFYWCFYYTLDSKHVENYEGIWSFYIIKENEYKTSENDYWGDGKWTPGINIGKQ